MRDLILSTCLYLYYHDCALCLDLGFKLLLQFYHERSLHRIERYQLNIEYATSVCYCCLLRALCCKMRIKKLRLFFKVLHKFIFMKKGGIRSTFLLFKRRFSRALSIDKSAIITSIWCVDTDLENAIF